MRKSLVLLTVLAVLAGWAPVAAQGVAAMSFEQLTIADTAVSLAFATVQASGQAAARCIGVLETASIRFRVDGTAPTASVGQLVLAGSTVDIRGVDNVRKFSAIRTGGTSGTLPMTCFPFPAETATVNYIGNTPTPAVAASTLQPDGTAALPAQSFAADTDSGLYRIGANNVGGSANGVLQWDWNASRFNIVAALANNGVIAISATAPTIASGFGTSSSVAASNGTAAFTVNVGTGGVATGGVLTMPTATTGWSCAVTNRTAVAANVGNARTVQTASTTTSVTVQNQTISTGAALAWTASDILVFSCIAY